jgi:hypothetical protein
LIGTIFFQFSLLPLYLARVREAKLLPQLQVVIVWVLRLEDRRPAAARLTANSSSESSRRLRTSSPKTGMRKPASGQQRMREFTNYGK